MAPARGHARALHRDNSYYDDAQRRKRSQVVLFLMENSSALSLPARRHMRWLKARSARFDRTPYEGWAAYAKGNARLFMQHWTQRLSAATMRGDARRALNALRSCAMRFSS